MYRKSVFFVWAAVAWITPAAIASALGWSSIWGSGSVFADFLIPIPVAGGVLHLPSFIVVSTLLFTQPWTGRLGGQVPGLLLMGALVGVATLLDLNKLQLAASTETLGGSFWQQQPLGLFILTDSLLAQLFVRSLGGRWPLGNREWAASLAVVLVIPLAYAAVALKTDRRQQDPFVYAGAREGDQRGDELAFYYSKLPLGSDGFRQAAAAVLARHDPRNNLNAEDIVIYFFDSLAPAQTFSKSGAQFTVCLYQDGTPTAWSPGSVDCFSGHESFSERFEKASSAQNASLPQDVKSWLGRRDACAGRKPLTAPPGTFMDNKEVRLCDPVRTEQSRAELLRKFEGDANALAQLR